MKHNGEKRRDPHWNLTYKEYNADEEKLRETLCTIGNGNFGTRGCYEGARISDTHYPGTYIAGVFNKLPSTVHDKVIYNDDFVNCPNWLAVEYKIDKSNYANPFHQKILHYEQNLNMRDAVMSRTIEVQDRLGRITRLESERFADLVDPHFGAIQFKITPVNYSAPISLRSSLDGTVINYGVPRYRNLSNKHLAPIDQGKVDEGIFIYCETNQSHIQIAMVARTTIYSGGKEPKVQHKIASQESFASEVISFDAAKGTTYVLEKIVSIATSRDENTASPIDAARVHLSRATSYGDMIKAHKKAWRELWNMADTRIEGDAFSQKVIRLHTYHLLTTASPNSAGIDAGMPARGLHGEAYRGHIFWDSIYALPFFYQRFPAIARSLLMYRYRRLDAARNYAKENGFEGAMFPWQSSNEGQEETQEIHFNPMSGNWDPDLSRRQRHISIAIFYNVYKYHSYTGDTRFLNEYGAEMMIEIARFWASAAKFRKKDEKYHICGVMGPDEFHEKYPGKPDEEGGVNDNAYTNVMVVWIMERAIEILDELSAEAKNALAEKIAFDNNEKEKWHHISQHMYVSVTKDGIVEQFSGYMKLKELDWNHYRKKYDDIYRMDRILKAEDDSPDRYKVAKQADMLMLFYVLDTSEVIRLLGQLGYEVKDRKAFLAENYEYYVNRTSHGSTLSKVAHAAIARDMANKDETWKWFYEALESDIYDTQGGTTVEGIHSAVMGGTITIISRVFAGIAFRSGNIRVKPALPKHWKRLSFKLYIRNRLYTFDITHENVSVGVDTDSDNATIVQLYKNGKS
ncbi:MAG: beta-phosphoglucomutase [Chitinivibrionales bacterium]|nr:beta-phosphoglucomutase [Chitinivibrionales bacterium]